MKTKILSMLLIVMMVLTTASFTAMAATGPSVSVTSTATTLVSSDFDQEVTLTFTLHNPDPSLNVAGVDFGLVSDSENLVLATNATSLTEDFSNKSYNAPKFVALNMEISGNIGSLPPVMVTESMLMTIKATLKANTPCGSYTISTSNLVIADTEGDALYNTNQSVTINVVDEAPVVDGDVNGDGKVSVLDVIAILRHDSGAIPLGEIAFMAADVNSDGEVDFVDAILTLKMCRTATGGSGGASSGGGGGGTSSGGGDVTVKPDTSKLPQIQLSNLTYAFTDDQFIIDSNEGAVGGMEITADVVAPSDVKEVLIATWGEDINQWSQDQIYAVALEMANIWKNEGFYIDGSITVPYEIQQIHPVDADEMGVYNHVLLVGLDENYNPVGYTIVSGTISR